jgi:hypothetical protein
LIERLGDATEPKVACRLTGFLLQDWASRGFVITAAHGLASTMGLICMDFRGHTLAIPAPRAGVDYVCHPGYIEALAMPQATEQQQDMVCNTCRANDIALIEFGSSAQGPLLRALLRPREGLELSPVQPPVGALCQVVGCVEGEFWQVTDELLSSVQRGARVCRGQVLLSGGPWLDREGKVFAVQCAGLRYTSEEGKKIYVVGFGSPITATLLQQLADAQDISSAGSSVASAWSNPQWRQGAMRIQIPVDMAFSLQGFSPFVNLSRVVHPLTRSSALVTLKQVMLPTLQLNFLVCVKGKQKGKPQPGKPQQVATAAE